MAQNNTTYFVAVKKFFTTKALNLFKCFVCDDIFINLKVTFPQEYNVAVFLKSRFEN